jgi:TPP-dependent indolepyruvate ferredoxin oxidoreductase alpha subunit
MVQKWYRLVCDYCGDVMNYWECSSVKVALDTEREVVKNSVIFSNGKTFCNRGCYKNYLANHRRSQDETDK